jgi:hypothetical protein
MGLHKQGKEATMLSSNQELQGKINDFIRRKHEQYPELEDTERTDLNSRD